jgi:hypothetical protein
MRVEHTQINTHVCIHTFRVIAAVTCVTRVREVSGSYLDRGQALSLTVFSPLLEIFRNVAWIYDDRFFIISPITLERPKQLFQSQHTGHLLTKFFGHLLSRIAGLFASDSLQFVGSQYCSKPIIASGNRTGCCKAVATTERPWLSPVEEGGTERLQKDSFCVEVLFWDKFKINYYILLTYTMKNSRAISPYRELF